MNEEEYQGIAKPVYDILSSHIVAGGKAIDGKIILSADHHALSFEIQKRLRELGYVRRSVALSESGNRLYICPICGGTDLGHCMCRYNIPSSFGYAPSGIWCLDCCKEIIPLATPQEVR